MVSTFLKMGVISASFMPSSKAELVIPMFTIFSKNSLQTSMLSLNKGNAVRWTSKVELVIPMFTIFSKNSLQASMLSLNKEMLSDGHQKWS